MALAAKNIPYLLQLGWHILTNMPPHKKGVKK